jgi:cell division septal protein FtsQ
MLIRGLFGLTLTAMVAAVGLAGSGLSWPLPIRRIVIEGATPLTESDLHTWVRKHAGGVMAAVDTAELAAGLATAMPLADVIVERRWPDALYISVRERAPYAMLLDTDGRAQLIDAGGRPASLRRDQALALWDRPVVRGCSERVEGETQDCAARAVAFLAWLDQAAPHWLESMSELTVTGDSVSLWLSDGLRIDFGQPPYHPKLAALRYAWALAQRHGLEIQHVVLTDRETVVLRSLTTTPDAPKGNAKPAARRNHEV